MQNIDFEHLVNATLEKDKNAFKKLYDISSNKNYFVALCVTKDEQKAVRIIQSAYFTMYHRLPRLKYPVMFEKWFSRIVCKTIYDVIVSHNPSLFESFSALDINAFDDELYAANIPEDKMYFSENDKIATTEILDRLSVDKKLCFLMYYFYQMGIEEIANVLAVDERIIASLLEESKKIV